MPRVRKIPKKPNFRRAILRAYQYLVQLDIKGLPVDPFAIVKNEPNIYLCSWTELRKTHRVTDPYNLKRNGADAKVQIIRGTSDYLIVFDDTIKSRERIRWTIAHEIGHILLGHLVYYEETALNRGGLTEEQYGTLEVEAHWFAEALLAPTAVLYQFKICDPKEIALLCDISLDAAEESAKHVRNYQVKVQHLEMTLVRNFFRFFYTQKHLQSIANGIFRYCGRRQYKGVYKICRICRNCRAYISDPGQKYCHVCGQQIANPDDGKGLPRIGKYYPHIDTREDGRILYCPVCKNHSFSNQATVCEECGTALGNICLHETTLLSGIYRYCPNCGNMTSFEETGLYDLIEEPNLPDLLTFKQGSYQDYIEYEYWEYIIASCYYANMDLYTALANSKAIRDEGNFVIFATDFDSAKTIQKHKDFLIRQIREYGQTMVTDVELIYKRF